MTRSLLTAMALAAFIAVPAVSSVQATTVSSDQIAQKSPKQDCTKIKDAQARAACMKQKGK